MDQDTKSDDKGGHIKQSLKMDLGEGYTGQKSGSIPTKVKKARSETPG